MNHRDVPLIPLDERPDLAARLLRVWRLQHLARGEELVVVVWPGEWPATHPAIVAGEVPVKYSHAAGGPGGMMIVGKVGSSRWRVAYTVASELTRTASMRDLKRDTVYSELSDDQDMTIWMDPSSTTGQVPMWKMRRPTAG